MLVFWTDTICGGPAYVSNQHRLLLSVVITQFQRVGKVEREGIYLVHILGPRLKATSSVRLLANGVPRWHSPSLGVSETSFNKYNLPG